VQHGDEDVKLIASRLYPMDDEALLARLRSGGAIRRVGPGAGAGAFGGRPGGAAAAGVAPRGPAVRNGGASGASGAGGVGAAKPAPLPTRTVDEGKLYLKISPDKEKPATLTRLQSLLKKHPGRSSVALFYERGSRVLELSVEYRVEVTTVLTKQLERLLGEGAVRRK